MRVVSGAARCAARCDAPVLLTGERGVGKQLVARLVHAFSDRRAASFIPVNCARASEAVLECALFGPDRHTDTAPLHAALFEPDRGTVFLREVGALSQKLQAMLMRVLDQSTLERAGSPSVAARGSVRVISAATRPLAAQVADAIFREDLYYRLNVIHIEIPPLRERVEDVEPLLEYFLDGFARQRDVQTPLLCSDAIEPLVRYNWPGNVRELRNVAERLVVHHHAVVTADIVRLVLTQTAPLPARIFPPAHRRIAKVIEH